VTTTTLDYTDLSIYERGNGPLPRWITTIRPHQALAVEQIEQAYARGCEVVFLDAPTGSGKTLIAELVRRRLQTRGVYVCSDRSLQRQFLKDFPQAALLEGRGNYPTEHGPSDKTCDDCTALTPDDACMWCDNVCPYKQAKVVAQNADLAVLNTSYLLAAANHTRTFTGEPFVVVDEADAMEDQLLGFVEYKVPKWVLKRTGLTPPIKAARKGTLIKWLTEAADVVAADIKVARGIVEPKTLRGMQSFVASTRVLIQQLTADAAAGADEEDSGKWVRSYEDEDTLHMKPVLVQTHGVANLWRHGQRWLFMSATLISVDEMVETLGCPFDYEVVTVPMTFPVEHRPIILAPIADMAYKAGADEYRKMAYAIQQVCNAHDGDRVLVHTVSGDRARKLIEQIEQLPGKLGKRRIVSYRSGKERDLALSQYLKTPGAVLFAQSMERGIDLPGDACRVQVIAKVPFPSLGDRRTSARLRLPGGEDWYKVQSIRSIVQMTGRGVRSAEDWATTYIFDSQFSKNLWRPPTRSLFPEWWREAVDRGRDVRQFILS
jgi:ATP-dependent DNA helicase DinG